MTETEPSDPVLKPIDAWWTVVLVDPVAVPLVRFVTPRRWVTPMRLTATAHLLGVVSAACFLLGWLVPAAVLFEVRFVLDCADGKLARVRGTKSAAGAFLDYVGDYLVVGLNIVALAEWSRAHAVIPAALAVGLPAAYLAHIAAGQAAAKQSAAADTPVALFSETVHGAYRSWMARRRLKPLPSRIEAEHGLVFVLPLLAGLTGSTTPVLVGAWVGVVYFGIEALHITRLGWMVARRVDDRAAGGRA